MKMTIDLETTKKKSNPSILGPKHPQYKTRTAQNGHILDLPEEGILELYPAGFTKPVNSGERKGVNRQVVFRELWEIALRLEKEAKDFPFGKHQGHYVCLEPDEENPADPNAISLMLYADIGHPLRHLNGADLGYVPMRISDVVKANLNMFRDGKIKYVRNAVHKKHFGARLVLKYGDQALSASRTLVAKRFRALMEED
jgi:hypothetical protein